jgi:DNA-binding response OmpR family regulator
VRGETYSGFERSIDSHIKRLRQKIEPDPARPTCILTVFGVGYRFSRGEDE